MHLNTFRRNSYPLHISHFSVQFWICSTTLEMPCEMLPFTYEKYDQIPYSVLSSVHLFLRWNKMLHSVFSSGFSKLIFVAVSVFSFTGFCMSPSLPRDLNFLFSLPLKRVVSNTDHTFGKIQNSSHIWKTRLFLTECVDWEQIRKYMASECVPVKVLINVKVLKALHI